MSKEQNKNEVGHRNHPLRRLQYGVKNMIPGWIDSTYKKGWLKNTQIAYVLESGENLHANDITLSALQVTLDRAQAIVKNPTLENVTGYWLGGGLDTADGPIADLNGEKSPIGAINDTAADREGDRKIIKLIGTELSKYDGYDADKIINLQYASQISTLTKAILEMEGIEVDRKNGEGGLGSMATRRWEFMLILLDLGKLNTENLGHKKQEKILKRINERIDKLIETSQERAINRVEKILTKTHDGNFGYNVKLNDPQSAASSEAGKYLAVCYLNEHHNVDIIPTLNTLTEGVRFPTAQELMENYPHLKDNLQKAEPFLQKVLEISSK